MRTYSVRYIKKFANNRRVIAKDKLTLVCDNITELKEFLLGKYNLQSKTCLSEIDNLQTSEHYYLEYTDANCLAVENFIIYTKKD